MLELGPRAVLMKGGHLESVEAVDLLIAQAGARRYAGPRIASPQPARNGMHAIGGDMRPISREAGTLEEAVVDAKTFVEKAIDAGRDVTLGGGSGPLMHLPLGTLTPPTTSWKPRVAPMLCRRAFVRVAGMTSEADLKRAGRGRNRALRSRRRPGRWRASRR